ncbi:hypothetical protein [Paenibacillus alginolyticus]|nr:hypothetical protein [Paenibacillus alginolyticus]MEC0148791.1 hypothetical protein [Paenibacillus alginolyticus]
MKKRLCWMTLIVCLVVSSSAAAAESKNMRGLKAAKPLIWGK